MTDQGEQQGGKHGEKRGEKQSPGLYQAPVMVMTGEERQRLPAALRDPVRVTLARHWRQRLQGWLGRGRLPADAALLLLPCRAVHSLGMTHALAVYFLDGRGRCLRRIRAMPPWRCAWHPRAVAVLELRAGQTWPGGWRALGPLVRPHLRRWRRRRWVNRWRWCQLVRRRRRRWRN